MRPNPVYLYLLGVRDELNIQLTTNRLQRAEAEDFLTRFSAARNEVTQEARLACQREAARQARSREAAIANANVTFLN